MERPDWTLGNGYQGLVLSTNCCHDKTLIAQVNEIIRQLDFNDLYHYPNEYPLYQTLSNYHRIEDQRLAIGHGLSELIFRVIDIFKNQRILIVRPTWRFMEVACKLKNVSYSTYEYQDFFRLNIDDIRELSKSHDVLYLANPNGINGTVLDQNMVLDLCGSFSWAIIDEAYADFSEIDCSIINHVPQNTLVLKTMSKSIAAAGLRMGYSIANKSITSKIQQLRPAGITNSFTEWLIPKIIDHIPAHIERMKSVRKKIEQLHNLPSSQANFILYPAGSLEFKVDAKLVHPDWHRLSLCDQETYDNIKK